MSSPRIIVNPLINGIVGGAASLGSLVKNINWPPTQPLFSFLPGTGVNQMDVWYDAIRQLASNTSETLDLTGTALEDPFGTAIAFGHIKLLAFYADPTNTTDLTIGNGVNPFLAAFGAAAHTIILKPGDLALFVRPTTGYVVTDTTADGLKVANAAGAAANYSLLIGGVSV